MTLNSLLEQLGYKRSENFLRKESGDFNRVVDYGHLLRKASGDPCQLRGVYALRSSQDSPAIPLVYVCDVPSEGDAGKVHRLVWNQDTVPFLIVNSPETVRLYPGFCRKPAYGTDRAADRVVRAFDDADLGRIVDTLHAGAIDTGRTWKAWGEYVAVKQRLNRRLLNNLKRLDNWLQGRAGLSRPFSHALIGKYIFLHYLRDRQILSDEKMGTFGIPKAEVFGREATIEGLRALQGKLDEWLNGEVFAINFDASKAPRDKHISRVAATFAGDEPAGADRWQLHLDFKAYDFSYIPIETLSTVYEQFLHGSARRGVGTRGRSAGAYYTPIPVVNFMLSELEEHRPLTRGMRVFDPACGSGAFLVQAYRRLIEKEFPPAEGHAQPSDLRDLLEKHFFGLDTEEDACGVARLSLILTLLDYVWPPDLETHKPGRKPRLPNLQRNIVKGNFFDDEGEWRRIFARKKADWIIGNPPWKQLKGKNLRHEDKPVLGWITANEEQRPVDNRQMARAFAWRVAEYLEDGGEIALFLPAMSLFEKAARRFRSRFFHDMRVHCVANFSNLRWVISGRRFTAPAAAFFYRPRGALEGREDDESVRTFSPLLANQEATRPSANEGGTESWSLVVNASEIRDIPRRDLLSGGGLPWKIAAWGSELDVRLLRKTCARFHSVGEIERRGDLVISEGLQLGKKDKKHPEEAGPEVVGANELDVKKLRGLTRFFAFPSCAIDEVSPERGFARPARLQLPLSVCRPPHVIVHAARNFAIYSDQFLIIRGRQIGIVSPSGDKNFLKALAVYLNSEFAFYYEFFTSPEFGIWRNRSTLTSLRRMPMPVFKLANAELKAWASLHDNLVDATRQYFRSGGLWADDGSARAGPVGPVVGRRLMHDLNRRVYEALGLERKEQNLIRDLVRVRYALNDGALGQEAVRQPRTSEVRTYAKRLAAELDAFVQGELSQCHRVDVLRGEQSGMARVSLTKGGQARGSPTVVEATAKEATALEECRRSVRQKRSQWVYFDRNLRVYDGESTYIMKPMQRFHWTETQARIDARDIVSESIGRVPD